MSEKYDEIKAYLKEEALKPASRLRMPTIAELMRRFRASQSPVSRAVHDLEKEGILLCRRGTGIVSCAGSAPYEVRPAREKGPITPANTGRSWIRATAFSMAST